MGFPMEVNRKIGFPTFFGISPLQTGTCGFGTKERSQKLGQPPAGILMKGRPDADKTSRGHRFDEWVRRPEAVTRVTGILGHGVDHRIS